MNGISLAKVGVVLFLLCAVSVACGNSHPANATEGNGPSGFQDTCTMAGQTRDCHVLLSSGSGYANCAAGTETCDGNVWGACIAGGTKGATYGSALLSSIPTGPGVGKPRGWDSKVNAGGLNRLDDPTPSSQAATLCTGDPCDPYCWGWDDVGTPPEAAPADPYGDYTLLPGMAQINQHPCHTGTGNESDCDYDTCCDQNGHNCVAWSSSTAGRCTPAGDSFGNIGGHSVGDCAGHVDYTVETACDSGGETHVTVCNRGGIDDPGNTVYIGFRNGGNPQQYPFTSANGGCILNFATIPSGLPVNACGDLDMAQGTFNTVATGVDCSSMGATPAARQGSMSGDRPIRINTTAAFGAAGNNDGAVNECNTGNNWSFSHHTACIIPPPPGGFAAPIALLTPNANALPCTVGTTEVDAKKCQYDTCCSALLTCVDWSVAAGGMCDPTMTTAGLVPFAGATNKSVGDCLTSPDYTIGVGCNQPGGGNDTHRHFSVCNRGGVDSPPMGDLHVGFGHDGSNVGSYPFHHDHECHIHLDHITLPAGTCYDLDVGAGTLNGVGMPATDCNDVGPDAHHRGLFFNGTDRAVFINSHPDANDANDIGEPECDGGNNWSFRQQGLTCAVGVQPPPPPTTFTYTGKCDSGYHSRWKSLSYNLSGGTGDVQMDVQGQIADPGTGTLGPVSAVYHVADPPLAPWTFTPLCDETHNNPSCPINLGDPARTAPAIAAPQMNTLDRFANVITLKFTESGTNYPLNWGVSYDCVPYE